MIQCYILLTVLILLIILYFVVKHPREFYKDNQTPPELMCFNDSSKFTEGLTHFRTKTLVICILLRNSENSVLANRAKAELIGSLFKDYRIIVLENDSIDWTRNYLLEWASMNNRVSIIGCPEELNGWECNLNLKPTIIHDRSISRIERMVNLRNMCLKHIRDDSLLRTYDYVLNWDMDILADFYIDGIGSSGYWFKNGVDGVIPEAICANTILGVKYNNDDPVANSTYYDTYAHMDLEDNRPYRTINDIKPPSCKEDKLWHVTSCFNGFTFYRLPSILSKFYELELNGNEAICEHTTLHKKMTRVYINPRMILNITN